MIEILHKQHQGMQCKLYQGRVPGASYCAQSGGPRAKEQKNILVVYKGEATSLTGLLEKPLSY